MDLVLMEIFLWAYLRCGVLFPGKISISDPLGFEGSVILFCFPDGQSFHLEEWQKL